MWSKTCTSVIRYHEINKGFSITTIVMNWKRQKEDHFKILHITVVLIQSTYFQNKYIIFNKTKHFNAVKSCIENITWLWDVQYKKQQMKLSVYQ